MEQMEQSKKMKIAKELLSTIDKLRMDNNVLRKQNQLILDKLHEDTKLEVQSVFDEEEQKWIDNYIKVHNLDEMLELLNID